MLLIVQADWYRRLREHARIDSKALNALDNAPNVEDLPESARTKCFVPCTESEAEEIPELSLTYCPDAVADIEKTLQKFRASRLSR